MTIAFRFAAALAALLVLGGCRARAKQPEQFGTLGDFTLVSQDGQRFGSAELRGKVWVGAFFFTRCPTICPRITRRLRELQIEAGHRGIALRLVSITVDPENDTPEVLRRYATQYQADTSSWTFLTGDDSVIRKTAEQGFKLAVEGRADAAAADFGILHGSHLVLVDQSLVIRGYYRTSDDSENERLLSDVERLTRR